MNISSEKISVFPFGTTRNTDPYARVFNEQNIARIIRSVVDRDSYVITWDSENQIIEFILSGYYFKANLTDVLKDNNSPVYANIKLEEHHEEKSGATYRYLSGNDLRNDDVTVFTGVEFSDKDLTSGEASVYNKSLLLLNLLNGSYEIPDESQIKLNVSSISDIIDLSKYATTEYVDEAVKFDVISCGSAEEHINIDD